MNCLECGEPLDDYSPCACALDGPRREPPPGARKYQGMRGMVARKLAAKAERKAKGES